MSARHATLLAALAADLGRLLPPDQVRAGGVLRRGDRLRPGACWRRSCCTRSCARRALPGRRWADLRERPKWALILGVTAVDGAVPADHLRRARRPERADRGADLARLAVHRAAGAVHPPQSSRSTAARALGMLLGLAGVVARGRRRVCASRQGVPRRAGDDRRGVLLRALELRGQGPLRQLAAVQTSWIGGHRRRHPDAAGRDRHDARPHPRRSARRRARRRSASSAPRWPSSSSTS